VTSATASTNRVPERLAGLLERALGQVEDGVMICRAVPGSPIEFVNPGFSRISGYAAHEVLGRSPSLMQGPETDPAVLDRLRADLESGSGGSYHTVNYRRDGSPFEMEWTISPLRDTEGSLTHWLAIQRDVTDDRTHERRYGWYAKVIEQAHVIVSVRDRGGRYVLANQILADLIGRGIDDVVGRSDLELFGEELGRELQATWLQVVRERVGRIDEHRIEAVDGAHVVDVTLIPQFDEDGAVDSVIAVGLDITRQRATERQLRELYDRSRQQHEDLIALYQQIQTQQELARDIHDRIIGRDNVDSELVNTWSVPAETFSGDLVLVGETPSKTLHVMLGDSTGHGLMAAVAAPPAVYVFHAMTAKGFGIDAIAAELNRKLTEVLPTGMFMACTLVSFEPDTGVLKVLNAGMPDVLLVDTEGGEILATFESRNLPLGIDASPDRRMREHIQAVGPNQRLLFFSDGLTELKDRSEAEFGNDGVELAIAAATGADTLLDSLRACANAHRGTSVPHDDITAVELICRTSRRSEPEPTATTAPEEGRESAEWSTTLHFTGASLRHDPVPMLISQLQDMLGLRRELQELFTVLGELYSNALEHGVLHLDSGLKCTPEGFAQYYAERASRLDGIDRGAISLSLAAKPVDRGYRFELTIRDSGAGFDHEAVIAKALAGEDDAGRLYGRGLRMVLGLCESVRYTDRGSAVEAVYVLRLAEQTRIAANR
jgi:PAS domain S-box-containing protein